MTFIREEIKGAKLKDRVQLILPAEERQIKVSPNLNFLKLGRLLHTTDFYTTKMSIAKLRNKTRKVFFFQLIFQCATSCREGWMA
jgi:hypothetical protein